MLLQCSKHVHNAGLLANKTEHTVQWTHFTFSISGLEIKVYLVIQHASVWLNIVLASLSVMFAVSC